VLGERLAPEGTGLYLAAGLMLLSLVVLGWPVFRGLSWRQVREDIGLTLGNRPGWEPLVGVGSYLMSLPLLGLGFIVTLFLMSLQREVSSLEGDPFAPAGGPAHPVIQPLVEGDWDIRLQIIFLASVVAPIVEETMFRGVLHRHLREASARFGAVMSILLSATVVSFIFAVIHPQGLIAVPALMGLAFGFSIAREWRGTLIPCMVAHGVSNGLVTMLAIMALGN
jgi:membrane protease YdiL (CAAX protease family)